MNKIPINKKVIIKYSLLQIPGLIILVLALLIARKWIAISNNVIIFIVILWMVKDFVLFFFVRGAYESDDSGKLSNLIGQKAFTQEKLAPIGYVSVSGELWKAKIKEGISFIEKDEVVRVIASNSLLLVVEPWEKE